MKVAEPPDAVPDVWLLDRHRSAESRVARGDGLTDGGGKDRKLTLVPGGGRVQLLTKVVEKGDASGQKMSLSCGGAVGELLHGLPQELPGGGEPVVDDETGVAQEADGLVGELPHGLWRPAIVKEEEVDLGMRRQLVARIASVGRDRYPLQVALRGGSLRRREAADPHHHLVDLVGAAEEDLGAGESGAVPHPEPFALEPEEPRELLDMGLAAGPG